MKFSLAHNPRFAEPAGFVLLAVAIGTVLSLVSYDPLDPSLNVAGAETSARNLTGIPGAYFADAVLQAFGAAAFLIPAFIAFIGWCWLRAASVGWPGTRIAGAGLLLIVACAAAGLSGDWLSWRGSIQPGGAVGLVLAENLLRYLNRAGSALALATLFVIAVYLLTTFKLADAQSLFARRESLTNKWTDGWARFRASFKRKKSAEAAVTGEASKAELRRSSASLPDLPEPGQAPPVVDLSAGGDVRTATVDATLDATAAAAEPPPIVPLEEEEPLPEPEADAPKFERDEPSMDNDDVPWDEEDELDDEPAEPEIDYRVPTTSLLHPPPSRSAYDPEELHATARRIAAKFEEFKVGGSVVQINPGPVVTTFEFKPDPGVKYSKIINLSEDLCLALECDSILVERIPGKSTVGIEAPNSKRDIISLREAIESRDFRESESPLTVAMGKDISGRLKMADLASMPHLLVAGSTGSGKSVMINTFIMSILMRATPNDVRFIMVDPKTVELGLYHDIPHLLTPVITDMKKASNAMKNAVTEMERRLKLLAEHSVRNIDQFNKKVDRMKEKFFREGNDDLANKLKRLPYIVIIIDELADLMMLEGRQIEESITRLAQMARAVGIHLVLATQRPSVDVITGLIKANVPARISFRLATRVDSRTILDSMGAEALLGRGDMLFLPPGTARMTRLHGPLVTEEEIDAVVSQWKAQGRPRYENEYLAPPADEQEEREVDEDFNEPMYEEAVRVVLQMGKASTSTLQRRLRLGYGRAARILDVMEREGIIGPPDGSRPREVLKAPDWLSEVEATHVE